jgi:hypothetical protein
VSAFLLIHDGLAKRDAFATNVNLAGALDEGADVPVALAAERAKGVARFHGATLLLEDGSKTGLLEMSVIARVEPGDQRECIGEYGHRLGVPTR